MATKTITYKNIKITKTEFNTYTVPAFQSFNSVNIFKTLKRAKSFIDNMTAR